MKLPRATNAVDWKHISFIFVIKGGVSMRYQETGPDRAGQSGKWDLAGREVYRSCDGDTLSTFICHLGPTVVTVREEMHAPFPS
jgi:hypothetical protein